MLRHLKFSISPIPFGLTPREAAAMSDGTIVRNVSLLGKTQTIILNAAPVIPLESQNWLDLLIYSPGNHVELPGHVDEFHAYYHLSKHPCVNREGYLSTVGAPTNLLSSRAVTLSKRVIKNAVNAL